MCCGGDAAADNTGDGGIGDAPCAATTARDDDDADEGGLMDAGGLMDGQLIRSGLTAGPGGDSMRRI